jgi:hypothetical protein
VAAACRPPHPVRVQRRLGAPLERPHKAASLDSNAPGPDAQLLAYTLIGGRLQAVAARGLGVDVARHVQKYAQCCASRTRPDSARHSLLQVPRVQGCRRWKHTPGVSQSLGLECMPQCKGTAMPPVVLLAAGCCVSAIEEPVCMMYGAQPCPMPGSLTVPRTCAANKQACSSD